ncbi:MAG: hypothetical protein LRS46_02275 [Desulfurococcales archaeon]|nr:hypothetical protein [Desulfurococcales archaeon]
MECRAVLKLPSRWAEALVKSLEPDNITAPPNVRVECRSAGELVECTIVVDCREPRDFLRLRNTVDDLLANLKAALEALESLET